MDRGESDTLDVVIKSGAAGVLAGGAAGLVWGGIGGRIAMRVLFLTSEHVDGVTSDDGFEIGRFSADTIFLLILTGILGGFVGLIYGLGRLLLVGPTWVVASAVTLTTGAFGGGTLVTVEGIDFRILEPLWLAVALFVLIPALWGATIGLVTERLLGSEVVFAVPPAQVRQRFLGPFGAVFGWLVLVALTTIGLVELANDISGLT